MKGARLYKVYYYTLTTTIIMLFLAHFYTVYLKTGLLTLAEWPCITFTSLSAQAAQPDTHVNSPTDLYTLIVCES